MIFDPFNSRLCRDVRNQLGHAMVESFETGSVDPFSKAVNKWKSATHEASVLDYINHRQACFENLFKPLETFNFSNAKIIPMLWNQKLYFECHEWLEEQWLKSSGKTKKGLQALILCAAAYEHQLYNRPESAKKVSKKAISRIREFKNHLPDWVDAKDIINHLTDLSPITFQINGENNV